MDPKQLWPEYTAYMNRHWAMVSGPEATDGVNEQYLQHLYRHIVNGVLQGAQETFGRTTKEQIWKNWISKKAQSISIQYHRFYRQFREKRQKTAQDWKELDRLRKKRNAIMNHYKHEWLQRKFTQEDIRLQDPWKVIAEVRDMNDTKGRSIPDLIDPDTKKVIATTTKEK